MTVEEPGFSPAVRLQSSQGFSPGFYFRSSAPPAYSKLFIIVSSSRTFSR